MLTVLRVLGRSLGDDTLVICRCDCTAEVWCRVSDLRHWGNNQGCIVCRRMRDRPRADWDRLIELGVGIRDGRAEGRSADRLLAMLGGEDDG